MVPAAKPVGGMAGLRGKAPKVSSINFFGKKWQLFPQSRIEWQSGTSFRVKTMDDKCSLQIAVERAWSVHLAVHNDVDAADQRRCSLERYLSEKWHAGESDPEQRTCYGLSYLARLAPESW